MDLDKDILKEMGITVIGDIIAILKHAKDVYREVIVIFWLLFILWKNKLFWIFV